MLGIVFSVIKIKTNLLQAEMSIRSRSRVEGLGFGLKRKVLSLTLEFMSYSLHARVLERARNAANTCLSRARSTLDFRV